MLTIQNQKKKIFNLKTKKGPKKTKEHISK